MKNGRFSDAQIIGILRQAEGGVSVSERCRKHGMSSAKVINHLGDEVMKVFGM